MGLIFSHTWPSVDGLRLPIWITVIINVGLLQRLYWLVLIYKRIASIIISDQVRDNAAYCVWSLSVYFQHLLSKKIDYLPEITTNGICYFE